MTTTGAENATPDSTTNRTGNDAGERGDNARGRGPGSDPVRALMIEGEAARILLHNLRDILADDEDAKADAIEGETNLREAIAAAVQQLQEMEAMAGAIKEREELLYARRQRCLRRADLIRAAVQTAMSEGQMRSLVLPIATLSLKAVPAKAIITDESAVPSTYWKRADPTLDKKAVLDALKYGTQVPGATLSNGSETLQVKP